MTTQVGDDDSGDPIPADAVQVDVAALYNAYASKIEDGARHVLAGNTPDVEDAVQTVVLKLQHIHQRGVLTLRQDWAAYLWRAGRNAALDIVTAQQDLDSLDQAIADGLGDKLHDRTEGLDPVADEVVLRHDATSLWVAMSRLGLDQRRRRIVTGAWLDDMTDAELGREFGISGQRVGVIRRDVQTRLARILQGGDHE